VVASYRGLCRLVERHGETSAVIKSRTPNTAYSRRRAAADA
jgi:hypothetical protein